MIRHFLTAAWRNLAANRLQSAIAIIGLSIGIAAALLMALVVRNQTSFDHFIPGHERTYLGVSKLTIPGLPPGYGGRTHRLVSPLLKLNAPELESTTRLMFAGPGDFGNRSVALKRGDITAQENIYWAEPNVFAVLPLPAISGDLATALSRPDGIVIPRAIAQKYFGNDNVVGQILLVSGHPMTVRAVIEDLPANATELQSGVFASSLASFSLFASDKDEHAGNFGATVITYIRLKPGASITGIEQRMPHFIEQLLSASGAVFMPPYTVLWLPLDQVPLFEGLHPGAGTKLAVSGLVGFLVLFIASVNFVNLLTARAARRALEVGVRKVCGAGRTLLIVQFLGESILTVAFAAFLAAAFGEWLLPMVNAFLGTGAVFDYWRNPSLLLALLAGTVMLGLAAGAYPAFVLSAFRPAGVLKGLLRYSPGAVVIRNALVVLQFAILITLVVAATVIYRQHVYATEDGLRANIDQMLLVHGRCNPAFRAELRKLPGVVGASCAGGEFLDSDLDTRITYKGQDVNIGYTRIDPGIFSLYGIKPLAGTLPPSTGDYSPDAAPGMILNQAAVKRLGFASPQAVIGQNLPAPPQPGKVAPFIRVVAVVPDFAFHSVETPIEAMLYTPRALARTQSYVSIKLKGQQIPETLAAIDQLWTATGQTTPITRFFLDDHMQQLYLSLLREAQTFAIFSGLAVFLACLGLLGLSISTAERRTKEIGIRKAMGASSSDITRLLLWQFTRPVLWANLIAWPLAWYAMNRWLNGFANHIALSAWMFAAATALAILVALFTVALQSILVARAVPATALRYE